MRYSKIRKMDISNGEGVGVSLFVQGCHFHCRGCFNQETWDFNGGKEFTSQTARTLFSLIDKSYIQRVSILGGEPLCDENVQTVYQLIQEIRYRFPDKNIWLYTGYNFDEIMKLGNTKELTSWNIRMKAVLSVDVVVDGQFQLENQDLFNEHIVFAGSTNQRIIKIKDFLKGEAFAK